MNELAMSLDSAVQKDFCRSCAAARICSGKPTSFYSFRVSLLAMSRSLDICASPSPVLISSSHPGR